MRDKEKLRIHTRERRIHQGRGSKIRAYRERLHSRY
jgi:hypothetical protein